MLITLLVMIVVILRYHDMPLLSQHYQQLVYFPCNTYNYEVSHSYNYFYISHVIPAFFRYSPFIACRLRGATSSTKLGAVVPPCRKRYAILTALTWTVNQSRRVDDSCGETMAFPHLCKYVSKPFP